MLASLVCAAGASACAHEGEERTAPIEPPPAATTVATIPSSAAAAPPPPAASASRPSSDPDHPPVTADERGVDEELGAARADRAGCDGACTGTVTPELEAALAQLARRTRHCYNVALVGDPSLEGRLSVHVRVGAEGDVCSVRVDNDTVRSRAVAYCVEHVFRDETGLPRPRGCSEVIVPIRFAKPKSKP